MTATLFQLVGGIGLFLLGMVLLTDALKAIAGAALQRALARFTGTPAKALGSGALVTTLVQSSSATTVTVIGFVSAGLLTFPQAIGVVLGASLGTTGTGWIIAVFGLTISIGSYALLFVGLGALGRLLGRGRVRTMGLAVAGFGLIFLGIDTMQAGMAGLSAHFDLGELSAGRLWGHLVAMGVGAVLTVMMQSSSAAVATTLTALHTGTIGFDLAASLVVGAAVGTTVTGALAAIGGTTSAKRTALAHVLFNLSTGLIAIVLLPVLLRVIGLAERHFGLDGGATSLAAFHTAFIALGVLIFLPLIPRFSAFIERALPERGPALTQHLDATLHSAPAVALEATRRALLETAREMLIGARAQLRGVVSRDDITRATQAAEALRAIQAFFANIPPISETELVSSSRAAQMLAIDHMVGLKHCLSPPQGASEVLELAPLQPARQRTLHMIELGLDRLRGEAEASDLSALRLELAALVEARHDQRVAIVREAAGGTWEPDRALSLLDGLRWLDRVAYHSVRLCDYLAADANAPELETPLDELEAPSEAENEATR